MFSKLIDVAKEIRLELVEVYWILLIPLVCSLIAIELIKSGDEPAKPGNILKRVIISILLLISFNEVINVIGMLGDGVINKIDRLSDFKEVLKNLGPKKANLSNEWFNLREHILYVFSLFSYIIAYLGFFIAEALTQFVWLVLYTISPLMILAYIPQATANITMNLYKGLVKVIIWKLLWVVLGALLLKLAMEPEISGFEDYIMSIVMNLCIGFSMLFVPMAARSLINDGLEGATSAMSAIPTMATTGHIKATSKALAKGGVNKGTSTLGFAGRPLKNLANRSLQATRHNQVFSKKVKRPIKSAHNWYLELGMNKEQKNNFRKNMRKQYDIQRKKSRKN